MNGPDGTSNQYPGVQPQPINPPAPPNQYNGSNPGIRAPIIDSLMNDQTVIPIKCFGPKIKMEVQIDWYDVCRMFYQYISNVYTLMNCDDFVNKHLIAVKIDALIETIYGTGTVRIMFIAGRLIKDIISFDEQKHNSIGTINRINKHSHSLKNELTILGYRMEQILFELVQKRINDFVDPLNSLIINQRYVTESSKHSILYGKISTIIKNIDKSISILDCFSISIPISIPIS